MPLGLAAIKGIKGLLGADNALKSPTITKVGNCFVAGTEILTVDGIKNIEDIQVGDWVIADDPTTPGEIEGQQVLDTFVRETDALVDLYVDGEAISTTGEHPFWVPDLGWVEAKDLVVGSLLQTEDGRIVDVDKIERREGNFKVYNFEVEGFPTYFVSELGVLVHNSCYDPSHPNRIDPTTLDLKELVNAANEPLGKGGLTKGGRALDKHATGQRGVSPFPPLTGNNCNKNLIAQQQVDEILYHPDVVFVGIGNKGAVEARIPEGRGIRFNGDGSLAGFVD